MPIISVTRSIRKCVVTKANFPLWIVLSVSGALVFCNIMLSKWHNFLWYDLVTPYTDVLWCYLVTPHYYLLAQLSLHGSFDNQLRMVNACIGENGSFFLKSSYSPLSCILNIIKFNIGRFYISSKTNSIHITLTFK